MSATGHPSLIRFVKVMGFESTARHQNSPATSVPSKKVSTALSAMRQPG
jgi:hypothetical protein